MGQLGGKGDSRGRRIDGVAVTLFLAAVERGAHLRAAADAAGFTISGFYRLRSRDPDFADRWREALEISARPRWIAPNNRRRLQRRAVRRLRFDERRQTIFLEHFAATCDATAAAAAANVCESTVYRRRQADADFAAEWDRALETGYARLEAEAVRQRLEAQRRLREQKLLPADIAVEFERVMKLLARYDRKGAQPGPRRVGDGRLRNWTFDQAMEALDRKLAVLAIPLAAEQG